jgi:hypothetical protein
MLKEFTKAFENCFCEGKKNKQEAVLTYTAIRRFFFGERERERAKA